VRYIRSPIPAVVSYRPRGARRHCATHQIRVILISGVVITSLFYPALAIYTSSQPRFLAHFTFQILDPFLAVDAVDAYYAQHDLVDLWAAHENIRIREDSVARARCGIEHTLRVEHIMIHDAHDVLNHHTLLAALELETAVAAALPAARPACMRRLNGACLALSPLEFWRHDARTLRADTRVRETLSGARNASLDAVPLAPSMVFAGRDGAAAQFLVFSYFFPETDCLGDAAHLAWRELLFSATEPYAYPFSSTQEPRVIELEVRAHLRLLGEGARGEGAFLVIAGLSTCGGNKFCAPRSFGRLEVPCRMRTMRDVTRAVHAPRRVSVIWEATSPRRRPSRICKCTQ
jgi:hypothetical protein